MFTVTKSCHNQDCITGEHLTAWQMQVIRAIVTCNWTDRREYQVSRAAGAFLQGYDERTGWILVEFWTGNRAAIDQFVEFVNKALATCAR